MYMYIQCTCTYTCTYTCFYTCTCVITYYRNTCMYRQIRDECSMHTLYVYITLYMYLYMYTPVAEDFQSFHRSVGSEHFAKEKLS